MLEDFFKNVSTQFALPGQRQKNFSGFALPCEGQKKPSARFALPGRYPQILLPGLSYPASTPQKEKKFFCSVGLSR
jgi:hypothetical protein